MGGLEASAWRSRFCRPALRFSQRPFRASRSAARASTSRRRASRSSRAAFWISSDFFSRPASSRSEASCLSACSRAASASLQTVSSLAHLPSSWRTLSACPAPLGAPWAQPHRPRVNAAATITALKIRTVIGCSWSRPGAPRRARPESRTPVPGKNGSQAAPLARPAQLAWIARNYFGCRNTQTLSSLVRAKGLPGRPDGGLTRF
jgi:hypothetical protein